MDEYLKENKEYIILGDKVNIRDEKGHLSKVDLFPNIDEILLLENREAYITRSALKESENFIKKSSSMIDGRKEILIVSLLAFTAASFNTIFFEDHFSTIMADCSLVGTFALVGKIKSFIISKKFKSIFKSYIATMELFNDEMDFYTKRLDELHTDSIDDKTIIRDEIIPVKDYCEYKKELSDRIDRFSNYGKIEKRLRSKNKKGILDEYLDSIGCTEKDKLIFKELITGTRQKTFSDSIPNQYIKR